MPDSSVSTVDFEQVNVQLVNILSTITLYKISIKKRNIKVNNVNLNYHESIVCSHPPHFSEHLSRSDLGQFRILGRNWHSRWG